MIRPRERCSWRRPRPASTWPSRKAASPGGGVSVRPRTQADEHNRANGPHRRSHMPDHRRAARRRIHLPARAWLHLGGAGHRRWTIVAPGWSPANADTSTITGNGIAGGVCDVLGLAGGGQAAEHAALTQTGATGLGSPASSCARSAVCVAVRVAQGRTAAPAFTRSDHEPCPIRRRCRRDGDGAWRAATAIQPAPPRHARAG
jgi:hypothetical protein